MADDLDFDAVEKLLDNADTGGGGEKKEKKEKKDKKAKDDRSRSRDRRRGHDRTSKSREREREKKRLEREKEMEERRKQEEEEERRRQIEDATRGDRTVMVISLNIKADERDVYQFFSGNAGKVRDVQIIRDARTGRSKGLAYIEFYLQESALKALALSGQCLKGQAIRVQPSQAEKNRALQAARQTVNMQSNAGEGPLRLYVGGLTDALAGISEEELKKLFSAFGEIEFIDLHRDPYTNKCKGYAFVQFKNASEAREAMTAMNGFQLAGQELKVGLATGDMMSGDNAGAPGGGGMLALGNADINNDMEQERDNPDAKPGGTLKDANARMLLMQKLQRDQPANPVQLGGSGAMAQNMAPMAPPMGGANIGVRPSMMGPGGGMGGGMGGAPIIQGGMAGGMPQQPGMINPGMGGMGGMGGMAGPATCIQLKGMFNPANANLATDPTFFDDIRADVTEECQKHGPVAKCFVDRNSRDGTVWVRFANPAAATSCQRALDRRWFAGSQISATFTDDMTFNTVTM